MSNPHPHGFRVGDPRIITGSGWKLSALDRAEAARRYLAGERPKALAKEYGVSPANIINLAKRRGARYYTEPLHQNGPKLRPEQRWEAARRYHSGESSSALAREYGVWPSAIVGYARRRKLMRIKHEENT